jgi:2-methylcitrate dehydratase PrpD
VLSFTEDARQNGDIIALAQKVSVVEDPQMSAQLPNLRPARVTITMTDGTTLDAAVQTNHGDWQAPYQADEFYKKYLSLTARLWSPQKAKQVHDLVMTLDQHGDMAAFFDAMAG